MIKEFKFPSWMGDHPRANTPWTSEECNLLIREFNEGHSIAAISKVHGRGEGGINSKLMDLLGKNFYSVSKEMSVEMLVAHGYRRVSNKHRIISRVDRPDWVEVLAKQMGRPVADYYDPSGRVSSMWADYYRRCISKDTRTLDEHSIKLVPTSGHDPVGYIEYSKPHIRPIFDNGRRFWAAYRSRHSVELIAVFKTVRDLKAALKES